MFIQKAFKVVIYRYSLSKTNQIPCYWFCCDIPYICILCYNQSYPPPLTSCSVSSLLLALASYPNHSNCRSFTFRCFSSVGSMAVKKYAIPVSGSLFCSTYKLGASKWRDSFHFGGWVKPCWEHTQFLYASCDGNLLWCCNFATMSAVPINVGSSSVCQLHFLPDPWAWSTWIMWCFYF